MDYHVKYKHLVIAATLCKLRLPGFWVHKARQRIKAVISSCSLCKKDCAISFKYLKVNNLPKQRVNFLRPFLLMGIDFTGHLWIQVEGERKKVYILLFTCLNIIVIHLELVKDMSTHSVILALVRFFNLYGVSLHIYSDNVRAFVAGCNLVKQVFVSDEFVGMFSTFNIKHLTISLYSAWFGSVWERLIKSVECCLFKLVGRKSVEYFEFLTLLSDVQNTINSRPFTYRCSGDGGLDIITPNAFFHPHFNTSLFLRDPEKIHQLSFREQSIFKSKNLAYLLN